MTDLFTHAAIQAQRDHQASLQEVDAVPAWNTRAYHRSLETVKQKATDALRLEIEARKLK